MSTYRVKIRRGENWPVKPEAEVLDGLTLPFERGFLLTAEDHPAYAGEYAMYLPREHATPALVWIASGDLEELT